MCPLPSLDLDAFINREGCSLLGCGIYLLSPWEAHGVGWRFYHGYQQITFMDTVGLVKLSLVFSASLLSRLSAHFPLDV